MVLYQVTHIPDGMVLGAGSLLTRNPGPYEIWAGGSRPKRSGFEKMRMRRPLNRRWSGGFLLEETGDMHTRADAPAPAAQRETGIRQR